MSILISVHAINWGEPPFVDPRYADALWCENAAWVEFASDVGSGRVMLMTSRPEPEKFEGKIIIVETGQRRVQDVRLLSPDEPRVPRLLPLSTPGDYTVVGEVQVIVINDETGERHSVEVVVGSGWFSLGVDEVSGTVVEGDWLFFTAVGLTFWDESG